MSVLTALPVLVLDLSTQELLDILDVAGLKHTVSPMVTPDRSQVLSNKTKKKASEIQNDVSNGTNSDSRLVSSNNTTPYASPERVIWKDSGSIVETQAIKVLSENASIKQVGINTNNETVRSPVKDSGSLTELQRKDRENIVQSSPTIDLRGRLPPSDPSLDKITDAGSTKSVS
jgi:hypothetical protein